MENAFGNTNSSVSNVDTWTTVTPTSNVSTVTPNPAPTSNVSAWTSASTYSRKLDD